MTRRKRKKLQRKERYRVVAALLRSAKGMLRSDEDEYLINQLSTLQDKVWNQNDLRYAPETLVFRAIRAGYSKREVIEAKTLVSGPLLDEALEKLTFSQKISCDDGFYVECFE